nr:tetratricopeptide repeat protein [Sphingomonas chungangi]
MLDGTADDLRATLAGSPEKAAELLKAGAEAGLPEAQAAYGQALLDERGVASDAVAALGWFRRAAAAGDAMGMNMLGRCFEKGWGTTEDRAEATYWYAHAAQAGLDWGMYNYGSALALGAGVEKDEAAALGWFQRAGAMGHAKSINFVGIFHEEGRVTLRDRAKAAECYRVAAESGDYRGQFNHARLLAEDGRLDEAVTWIGRAAETAPPAFVQRVKAWCEAAPVAALNLTARAL